MSYPAQWRSFFVNHMLPFEGGYVPTNDSIFGILKENWADLIMKIPQAEINRQSPYLKAQLMEIRQAPAGERLDKTVEWIRDVARHTHAWGNKTQPASGKPYRSEEYASAKGNPAYLSAVHELAFGIFYRDYIQGVGITDLPVQHRIQETVADISVRYGTAHSYALLVKAMEDSGVISSQQMNTWGWVRSEDLPDGPTYQQSGAGYRYTLTSTRREIAAALEGATPQQQQVLFDYYGKWRRTYDAHKDNQKERVGDDKRTYALHDNPSAALGRIGAAEASGLAVWKGDAVEAARALASYPATVGQGASENVALVQMRDGWLTSPEIGLELPGFGRMVYEVKTITKEDGTTVHVMGDVKKDEGVLKDKIEGVDYEILPINAVSKLNGKAHNFQDTVIVVWRLPDGKLMDIAIPPRLNELALQGNQNTWLGFINASEFTLDDKGRLSQEYSAPLQFTDASHDMVLSTIPAVPGGGLVPQANAATTPSR